jgi:DnaK suppressor protein
VSLKDELSEDIERTVHTMQDEATVFADPNDRASQESDIALELRNRDRERKLIKKIDESIGRIEAGEYGYCDSCGVEIGLKRLEARPTATLCIDCKTLEEMRERRSRSNPPLPAHRTTKKDAEASFFVGRHAAYCAGPAPPLRRRFRSWPSWTGAHGPCRRSRDLDAHDLAFLEVVGHGIDALVGDLRDVQQAVLARQMLTMAPKSSRRRPCLRRPCRLRLRR